MRNIAPVIYSDWRKRHPLMAIDTKFQSLYERDIYGNQMFKTSHFFQLLSYTSTLRCYGLLVYPGAEDTISKDILEWKSLTPLARSVGVTVLDLTKRTHKLGDDLVSKVQQIISSGKSLSTLTR